MDDAWAADRGVARCRIALSLGALAALALDPTGLGSRSLVFVLLGHLAYSFVLLGMVRRRRPSPERFTPLVTAGDMVAAIVVAILTEDASAPFYFVFFGFAIVPLALRAGLRWSAVATTATVAAYATVILLLHDDPPLHLLVLRSTFLAILGWVVGYLGQELLNLSATVRSLESNAQRTEIARSLHDGFCQALAGVNLRLETCRQLLRNGRTADALAQLGELQKGVTREYDELRSYVRSLADVETRARAHGPDCDTLFTFRADVVGTGTLLEHVLQMSREAVANVLAHANASTATITIHPSGSALVVAIDDDGAGLPADAGVPWSIASRAAELAGDARVVRDGRPGAHLEIVVPSLRSDARPWRAQ